MVVESACGWRGNGGKARTPIDVLEDGEIEERCLQESEASVVWVFICDGGSDSEW